MAEVAVPPSRERDCWDHAGSMETWFAGARSLECQVLQAEVDVTLADDAAIRSSLAVKVPRAISSLFARWIQPPDARLTRFCEYYVVLRISRFLFLCYRGLFL